MDCSERAGASKLHDVKEDEKTNDQEIKMRVRLSVRELSKDPVKLNAFLRAFKKIQELPPDNPNSFWVIAGYHGEPFEGTAWTEGKGWGGYCQHGNVLFPFWHRAYLLRLENALRSVMEIGDDVTIPYWDYATNESIYYKGVPEILTRLEVNIDGKTVPNPLRSYEFPLEIGARTPPTEYYKPKNYKTCRYPYSGLQSSGAKQHNSWVTNGLSERKLTDRAVFNANMADWMTEKDDSRAANSVYVQLNNCLEVESYTSFSNVCSAKDDSHDPHAISLEQPHNDVHLFTGGFTKEKSSKDKKYFLIPGGNGDMGENETAAFDPIFFLHHANIDRMFWVWQKKHGKTTSLTIEPGRAGTYAGYKDTEQKAAVGETNDEPLTLDTPLMPFKYGGDMYITARQLIDINGQCLYDYSNGSFDTEGVEPELNSKFWKYNEADGASKIVETIKFVSEEKTNTRHVVEVTGFLSSIHEHKVGEEVGPAPAKAWREDFVTAIGFNKADVVGSFVVRAWYKPDRLMIDKQDRLMIGQKGILDRWDASTCNNCQKHRKANVSFSLGDLDVTDEKHIIFDIVCHDLKEGGKKVLTVSTNASSEVMIDAVKFHSVFTNKPQSVRTNDEPRVDFRRPVAWDEATHVGLNSCCLVQ